MIIKRILNVKLGGQKFLFSEGVEVIKFEFWWGGKFIFWGGGGINFEFWWGFYFSTRHPNFTSNRYSVPSGFRADLHARPEGPSLMGRVGRVGRVGRNIFCVL